MDEANHNSENGDLENHVMHPAIYRCKRSRLLYLAIGLFYTIVLAGLGISFLVNNEKHKNPVGGATFAFVAAAVGACFVVLACRSATIKVYPNQLVYRGVFRSRTFSRTDIADIRSGLRYRFPSPVKYQQPVVVESDGTENWLTDFSVPPAKRNAVRWGGGGSGDYDLPAI